MGLVASAARSPGGVDWGAGVPDDLRDEIDEAERFLKHSSRVLAEFSRLGSSAGLVRNAIALPSDDSEQRALDAVSQGVLKAVRWHAYVEQAGQLLADTTRALMAPGNTVASQLARGRVLARLLNFMLRFDEFKRSCPQVQNELAYYRRNYGPLSMHGAVINANQARGMSSFYSEWQPCRKFFGQMLGSVAQGDRSSGAAVCTLLAALTHACAFRAVDLGRMSDEAQALHALRAMTGAFVLHSQLIQTVGNPGSGAWVRLGHCTQALGCQAHHLTYVTADWVGEWRSTLNAMPG